MLYFHDAMMTLCSANLVNIVPKDLHITYACFALIQNSQNAVLMMKNKVTCLNSDGINSEGESAQMRVALLTYFPLERRSGQSTPHPQSIL